MKKINTVIYNLIVDDGLGDILFGFKLAKYLHTNYPDMEITLVTRDEFNTKCKTLLKNSLQDGIQYSTIDQYEFEKDYASDPDFLIIGPVFSFDSDDVHQITKNGESEIILIGEYDLSKNEYERTAERLSRYGLKVSATIRTGLSGLGIFFDEWLMNPLFTTTPKDLTITAKTLMGENETFRRYLSKTNISVNYSHDNAKKVIHIHTSLCCGDKNTDLIMMGENAKKDLLILYQLANSLIEKGYSRVIYHEPNKIPSVLAQNDSNGPQYRLIHTGKVSFAEARALRKLSTGILTGATGDQSYSEAISVNPLVIYECRSWKSDLYNEMVKIANSIDESGRLSSVIKELGSTSNSLSSSSDSDSSASESDESSSDSEDNIISKLRSPDIIRNLKMYQQHILQKNDLEKNISTHQPGFFKRKRDTVLNEAESDLKKARVV
ncbi:MAG: hypothetical protein SFW66_03865 [Gammaproteobacteria bacterium]|nr:hypothetical protein [Gammaproteobacteria bacterium]